MKLQDRLLGRRPKAVAWPRSNLVEIAIITMRSRSHRVTYTEAMQREVREGARLIAENPEIEAGDQAVDALFALILRVEAGLLLVDGGGI